jgi:hypothetical protein
MATQGLTERIDARIREALSDRDLTPVERRAELLKRSPWFLDIVRTIQADVAGEMEDLDRLIKEAKKPKPKEGTLGLDFLYAQRKRSKLMSQANWDGFCGDFGIDTKWNGSIEILSRCTLTDTAIVISQTREGKASVIHIDLPPSIVPALE